MPAPGPAPTIPRLASDLEAATLDLERHLAAFTSLQMSYLSATNALPDGARKKGMPILEFTASVVAADTNESVKCALDFKYLNQDHVHHVFVPLLHMEGTLMLRAIAEIEKISAKMRPLLEQIISTPVQADPQQ